MARLPTSQESAARSLDHAVEQASALVQANRFVEARAICQQVLQKNGRHAGALHILGTTHHRDGDAAEAVKLIARAIKRGPATARMHVDLGLGLQALAKAKAAVVEYRQALRLDPKLSAAHFHLAQALVELGDMDGAIAAYEACLKFDPADVAALVNLGGIYKAQHRYDDAITSYDAALAVMPTLSLALRNIAATFREQGFLHASLAVLERARSVAPDDKGIAIDLAAGYLALGRFTEGWAAFEERYQNPEEYCERRPSPPAYWQGEDLRDKRLLIWTEQGVGDEVLYASMIPDIAARAKHCVLECSARLAPVFARSFPTVEVIAYKDYRTRVTSADTVDYQVSIASLGQYLRPSFDNFPKHAGYLKADPGRTAVLRARYRERASDGPVIGVSWRSTNATVGASKSMTLAGLAPILRMSGATFVNLQYGDCAADLAEVKATLGVDVIHDTEVDPLTDMDAFFAQIAAMDAVVSTSNTTVHVAGSLNIPTWVLLPYAKGNFWYWFRHRTDSPWYPSVRLIREKMFDPSRSWWDESAAHVADEIAAWVRTRS